MTHRSSRAPEFDVTNLPTPAPEPKNANTNGLVAKLIRNFNGAPMERLLREPHYDSFGARLACGTSAQNSVPLKYVSVSTWKQPEICEDPDSGKFMAESRGSLDAIQSKPLMRLAGQIAVGVNSLYLH